jgi:hypothetical protein
MNDKTQLIAFYLKANLDSIRKQLGRSCSYLSYVKTKKKLEDGSFVPFFGVKAKMDGFLVEVGFKKEFSQFTTEDFENIYNTLVNKEYASEATV